MRQFLRKVRAREPLPLTMSGVRMGERLLQIGITDARMVGLLVTKVGLSGHAAIAVVSEDAARRARQSAADVGGLADVHVVTFDALPFDDQEFDAIVLHGMDGLLPGLDAATRLALLRECHRVLRPGGRLVAMEAAPRTGISAIFRTQPTLDPAYDEAGGTIAALESAGFKPTRRLGEGEGFRFAEGLRRR